jgi:hypothetical protein
MRRYKRRKAEFPCTIELESGEQYACRMLDVSPIGAQISEVEPLTPIGATVLMSWDQGRSRRACRVVWRKGKKVGLQFIRGLPEAMTRAARKRYGPF